MPVPLERSLTPWRRDHGFGILNIIAPTGEYFYVETRVAADCPPRTDGGWIAMSESQLNQHLVQRGMSDTDAADAIHLAREWATRISNQGFFPLQKAN